MSTKKENVAIWKDTIKQFTEGKYKNVKATDSVVYSELSLTPIPKYESTTIKVVDIDTLSCCQQFVEQGHNVMGLNMASPSRPGGGVDNGSFSQEENCFRRSNYFKVMNRSMYPLPETSCIYSKITVIKDQSYNFLKVPFDVSMVACAALRHPPITKQGRYLNDDDRKMMKYKIQQIFQVGYQEGHDTLVLGAFGCGAFYNPQYEVAELFNEVIKQYWGCFKNIIFAIMSYNDDNLIIFDKVIKQTDSKQQNGQKSLQITEEKKVYKCTRFLKDKGRFCNSEVTTSYEVQPKSVGESKTTFIKCSNCGNQWKLL